MAEAGPIWEQFLKCKSFAQSQSFQTSQHGVLGGILSSSSAVNANSETATLMRELTVRPISELLSHKALQELSSRNRLVDFMRVMMRSRTKCSVGQARVQEIARVGIQAIHSGLVVDKPAHDLQNILLAELDDISPDHVPAIVDAILAPLLAASRRQIRVPVGCQHPPPPKEMSEAAGAAFLVVLDILPKVLGVTAGVPAFSKEAPVPEDMRGISGAQYKERVVSRLFRARWPGVVSVGMCQTLRDLGLGER
ncbi:unnamed protein product, partial [Scytosiphon promiscuus]